jgi:hypothetical protein
MQVKLILTLLMKIKTILLARILKMQNKILGLAPFSIGQFIDNKLLRFYKQICTYLTRIKEHNRQKLNIKNKFTEKCYKNPCRKTLFTNG